MKIIQGTSENFEAEVLQSEIPVLVDFNATWCGPCKMLKPVLHELAEESDDYKIVAIDVDDEADLAEEYEVSSIPCMVLFEDGEEVDRRVGFVPKEVIEDFLKG